MISLLDNRNVIVNNKNTINLLNTITQVTINLLTKCHNRDSPGEATVLFKVQLSRKPGCLFFNVNAKGKCQSRCLDNRQANTSMM